MDKFIHPQERPAQPRTGGLETRLWVAATIASGVLANKQINWSQVELIAKPVCEGVLVVADELIRQAEKDE